MSFDLDHESRPLAAQIARNLIQSGFGLLTQRCRVERERDRLRFALRVVVNTADAAFKRGDSVIRLLHTLIGAISLAVGGLSCILSSLSRLLRLACLRVGSLGGGNPLLGA